MKIFVFIISLVPFFAFAKSYEIQRTLLSKSEHMLKLKAFISYLHDDLEDIKRRKNNCSSDEQCHEHWQILIDNVIEEIKEKTIKFMSDDTRRYGLKVDNIYNLFPVYELYQLKFDCVYHNHIDIFQFVQVDESDKVIDDVSFKCQESGYTSTCEVINSESKSIYIAKHSVVFDVYGALSDKKFIEIY